MAEPLRIVFAGTPAFAAQHLQALLQHDFHIVGVYTQPDRPAGRGKKLQPSAVKELAQAHEIEVYQPVSLKTTEAQQQLAALKPDLMIVVAYGLLLPQAVLDIPTYGCLNVHGSLLPRWRGAAPIQRAIWAGDTHSGVAIMQMEAGLDTGPVLHEVRCTLSPDETSASLYSKLEQLGPAALLTVLDDLAHFQAAAQPQNEQQATYAKKLTKDEGGIDWTADAEQIARNVRAFFPWPTAWFSVDGFKGGQSVVKVIRAVDLQQPATAQPGTIVSATADGIDVACGSGTLRILEAQVPGKKPQPAATLVNGYRTIFCQHQQLN